MISDVGGESGSSGSFDDVMRMLFMQKGIPLLIQHQGMVQTYLCKEFMTTLCPFLGDCKNEYIVEDHNTPIDVKGRKTVCLHVVTQSTYQ